MPVSTSTSSSNFTVTGQQAIDQAAANKKAQAIGKQTTDKGTLIVRSTDNQLDGTSFLKIMIAQMKNLDPTANQDNTAYVTQMAQMTTMQQMNDLNKTMSAYSYQSLLGKGVTVDIPDMDGNLYTGIVRGVSKENNAWYLSVDVKENGKIVSKVFDASKLKSVLGISDSTNSNMLINSDFMAASNLASNKENKVVILNTDSKGTQSIVKGTVKSAYLDNGIVKVRVAEFDSAGNESTNTTDYPYSYIVKAGNLTDKDMDVKLEDYVTTNSTSASTTIDPNDPNYNKEAMLQRLASSTTDVKASSNNDFSTETINDQAKKAQEISDSSR